MPPEIAQQHLVLVDGHAYAYRAYHAIRSLNSPSGFPTNAIYGFKQALRRVVGDVKPTHGAVVWDAGLAQHRLELLPGYKANRPEMPSDLGRQIPEMVELVDALGWNSVSSEGVEADDLIGKLADQAAESGFLVSIGSPDKDFMQCVRERVQIYNPGSKSAKVVLATEDVVAKTGVRPSQIVDWLSMIGDAVDNIPGVAGVGPKTATRLLAEHGTLEGIYEAVDQVAQPKLRQALVAARGTVFKNRAMVKLDLTVPCEVSPPQLSIKRADHGRLEKLYSRWGFTPDWEQAASLDVQQELFTTAGDS